MRGRVVVDKIFILDTSALITLVQDVTTFREGQYPGFASVLADNEIILPRIVLDELERLKDSSGERAHAASEAARQLEHYSTQGSLTEGVETEKGGVLKISPRPPIEKVRSWGLELGNPSHEILATALEIEDSLGRTGGRKGRAKGDGAARVVLLTQDSILRVLARSVYGLVAEELMSVCAPEMDYKSGFRRIELSGEELDRAIERGNYPLNFVPVMNEFVVLVNRENPEMHYCYTMVRDPAAQVAEVIDRTSVDYLKVAGEVRGRNIRQKLLLWGLMGCGEPDPMADEGIRLITISGPAGSGKSFLALAAAWERLERGQFDRIIVTRPMIDVGTPMGFLPGSLEEKLRPWGGFLEDNLRAIVQVPTPEDGRGGSGARRGLQRTVRPFDAKTWLEMEDRLELVPLTYIRGRTFRRSFVILEEAQNLERGPLKVLLTRMGEGSICVIIGDRSQIDNHFLSERNNGLVHTINAFRTWPQAVHLHLKEIVRSDLAEAASRLL